MNKRLQKEIAEGLKALDKVKKPEGTGGKDLYATAANAPLKELEKQTKSPYEDEDGEASDERPSISANRSVDEDAPANSVAGGGVAGIRPGEVVVRKKPKPSTPEDNTNPESTGRKLLHFKDFLKQK